MVNIVVKGLVNIENPWTLSLDYPKLLKERLREDGQKWHQIPSSNLKWKAASKLRQYQIN